MSDKICVGNGRLFYFNNYCKLELFYIEKIHPVEKTSVI